MFSSRSFKTRARIEQATLSQNSKDDQISILQREASAAKHAGIFLLCDALQVLARLQGPSQTSAGTISFRQLLECCQFFCSHYSLIKTCGHLLYSLQATVKEGNQRTADFSTSSDAPISNDSLSSNR